MSFENKWNNTAAQPKAVDLPSPSIEEEDDRESTIASGSTDELSPSGSEGLSAGGLSAGNISARVTNIEYAVRGLVLDRALEIQKDFSGFPFKKLVKCHIGNPHAVGLPAITYIREVISLVTSPLLDEVDESVLQQMYQKDSIERARKYRGFFGEPGAYTHSQGAVGFREEIADWLERRDGVRPVLDRIFMSNGASDAIESILQCLIMDSKDAILLPLPQYPLYSATITKIGGTALFYELNESKGWSLDMGEVQRAYDSGVGAGYRVRAIAVICPGNPAPTLLSREEKAAILRFAQDREMTVMADEVYQDNIYHAGPDGSPLAKHHRSQSGRGTRSAVDAVPKGKIRGGSKDQVFIPFRKVLLDDGLSTQLVSFHSSSKGLVGECGFRGGLMVLDNVDNESRDVVYKLRSVTLCPNTIGQAVMALVTNPPLPGSPSYAKYILERETMYAELKTKADLVHHFFNSLSGTSCQRICGGMYAFPKFEFSKRAVDNAECLGMTVNLFYCIELLEATGIVTVPGCGFGEAHGSHHIRMTILPALDDLKEALKRYRHFHERFWRLYCL